MNSPNEKQLISEVVQMLRDRYDELDITLYLREKGLEPEHISPIIEEAKNERLAEKMTYLPQRNKRIFWVLVAITVVVLIIDFFVLPSASLIGYSTMLSILGSGVFVFCCYLVLLHYKTWTPEFLKHRDTPKYNFSFLPFFLIPAMIVYFIMSSIFDSKAKNDLTANMERTTGTIMDGHSYSSRKFDFTEVTVQFKTKTGQLLSINKDISKYNFKEFYKGQTVDVLYSRSNPQIIEILTENMSAQDVTHSEERDITIKDLLSFLDTRTEELPAKLDKITFGWSQSTTPNTWINNRKNLFLESAGNSLVFHTTGSKGLIFPRQLTEAGFERQGEAPKIPYSQAPQSFENDKFSVVLKMDVIRDQFLHTVMITKK